MQTTLNYRHNRDLFSNYYLEKHLPETEAWDELGEKELHAVRDEIAELWKREKGTAPQRNESQLEEKFIRPVFRMLDIPFEVEESTSRTRRRPDYGFFESDEAARSAFDRRDEGDDFYRDAIAVADAKRWDRSLDTRAAYEHERDFENPSYQIHVYLQETSAEWAVLTNGRKWRLYFGPTSHRLDSFYEIDLPTLMETGDIQDFKYFYLFFRQGAFLSGTDSKCFLDLVYTESNLFARELGEGLQDNIYEAIRLLAEGFVEYPENNVSEADLDLVHDSSLIYLYRLIFVLYAEAESRELLDTSNKIYDQSYGLNSLKQTIAEELDSQNPKYRNWQDELWDRLQELFGLIDKGSKSRGIPKEELYIPAYNGGLFRTTPGEDESPEVQFLMNHRVGDSYLAKVIELLTRSEKSDGAGKIFVDYSSLDVRHLGSIYEGLLEYQLNIASQPLALEDGEYVTAADVTDVAVAKGDIYISTGAGERKVTGSYYTPEYVVEYIVDQTVEPLVEQIRGNLLGRRVSEGTGFAEEFTEAVLDLKVLDPAMGSGHFLTSVIDRLAREIIDAQERQAAQQGADTVDLEQDINWARRKVAQHCVYGVDLNPLAVELSKVSLWLRTLAADQPLAFLDHHLKTGNSLIGSDIREIDELETDLSDDGQNQSTLAQYGAVRQGTIEQLMSVYEDFIAIENQDRVDAKEMERKYRQIEQNELRNRLVGMANVKTADDFGMDIPNGAYERMARAITQESDWHDVRSADWYQHAQSHAKEKNSFHWMLEFPEAFYDNEGRTLENPGFDAVVGNPPYVRIYRGALPEDDVSYWRRRFAAAHMKFDLYTVFMECSIDMTCEGGYTSMIVPDAWMNTPYGEPIRNQILDETNIQSILDLREQTVFAGVSVSNVIPVLSKGDQGAAEFPVLEMESDGGAIDVSNHLTSEIIRSSEDNNIRLSKSVEDLQLTQKVEARSIRFDEIYYANWGLRTGTKEKTEKFVHDSPQKTNEWNAPSHPMLRGQDIMGRYCMATPDEHIVYHKEQLYNPMFEELFENDKIVFRKIGSDGLMAAVDENSSYCFSTLIPATNIGNVAHVDRQGVPEMNDVCSEYSDPYYALALVNSKLMSWYYQTNLSDDLSVVPGHVKQLPIAEINFDNKRHFSDEELTTAYEEAINQGSPAELMQRVDEVAGDQRGLSIYHLLRKVASRISELNRELTDKNTDIMDYLGGYADVIHLPDLGNFRPHQTTILDATTETHTKLRIGQVTTDRRESGVQISATARYKPEIEDASRTDRWGYVETEFHKAFTLTNLDEREAILIEQFVPAVCEIAGGRAGFREKATKNNSLSDRLKAVRLPDLDDVGQDFDRYIQANDRAVELEEDIRISEAIVNDLVYALYELTDQEIELIET